jgi:hypothetical protein
MVFGYSGSASGHAHAGDATSIEYAAARRTTVGGLDFAFSDVANMMGESFNESSALGGAPGYAVVAMYRTPESCYLAIVVDRSTGYLHLAGLVGGGTDDLNGNYGFALIEASPQFLAV